MHGALVEAVECGDDIRCLNPPRVSVDDLLPEGVLVVVVDEEVGAESVPQEGVVVLEYYLYVVFSMFSEAVAGERDAVRAVPDVLRLQPFAVDLCQFYPRPAEVEVNSLPVAQSLQVESNVHDTLIAVAFHQAKNDSVLDLLYCVQKGQLPVLERKIVEVLDDLSRL